MNKLFIVILISVFFSCKGFKTIQQAKNNQSKEQISDTIYHFNISFISIGSGIDGKAKERFLAFVNDFQIKRNILIEMETVNWGREGEIDYCFKLTQLNSDEQAKFISDTKELLKTSKLVRYSQNIPCKNKRN